MTQPNWTPIVKALAPKSPPNIFNPFVAALPEAFDKAEFNTPLRQAHFLSEVVFESDGLSVMTENLNYSDPARIAKIFRSPFDLDHDKIVDPEEIEFAKGYVHQPQKLANRAYANRNGNGDEASGDGWRFRGRAFLQHTFRDNYKELSTALGVDLVTNPDRLLEPGLGLRAAIHFFVSHGCLPYADTDNTTMVRKKINGGDNGLAEVRALKDRCLKLLGVSKPVQP